jgi:antitoxin component HigA of HigAB toxin-antitoxin module
MNTNNVQIIKSDKQYERCLGKVNELMDHDPDPNSLLAFSPRNPYK